MHTTTTRYQASMLSSSFKLPLYRTSFDTLDSLEENKTLGWRNMRGGDCLGIHSFHMFSCSTTKKKKATQLCLAPLVLTSSSRSKLSSTPKY